MERQDDRPRAHPEGEAARYEEGAPEEGPAAADADREYSDTGAEQADTGGQAATATARSEAPVEGQAAGAAESQLAGSGTAERERAYDGATERQAVMPPGGDAARTQPADAETAGADRAAQAGSRATETDYQAAHPDTQAASAEAGAQTAGDPRWEDRAGEQTGQTAGDPRWEDRAGEQTGQPAGGQPAGGGPQTTPGGATAAEQPAGLSDDDAQTFRGRWESIQGTFIDDPHGATEQADALVGEVMERLSRLRNDYLRDLRQAIGDGSDTEAMRVALTRYRAFFLMLVE